MRFLGAAVTVAAAVPAAGCGGPDKLSEKEVERGAHAVIAKKGPDTADNLAVDCPKGVDAEEGATVRCDLVLTDGTAEGVVPTSTDLEVKVEKVDGDKVTYSVNGSR